MPLCTYKRARTKATDSHFPRAIWQEFRVPFQLLQRVWSIFARRELRGMLRGVLPVAAAQGLQAPRARVRKSICYKPTLLLCFSLALFRFAQILLPLTHRRRRNHIFGAVESLDFLIAKRLLTAACVWEKNWGAACLNESQNCGASVRALLPSQHLSESSTRASKAVFFCEC